MSNTLSTTEFVAKKALAILRNKVTFAKIANRDYQEMFTSQSYAPGLTVNIRRPVNFVGGSGPNITPEPITERIAPLTITDQPNVSFQFDSQELSLLIENGGHRNPENMRKANHIIDRYVEPAIARLAQIVEGLVYGYSVLNSNYFIGTPGTLVNNPGTINLARVAMNKLGIPTGKRFCVVSHDTEGSIQNSMNNFFDLKYTDPILREGYLGYNAGSEFAASTWVVPHTAGIGAGGSPSGGFIAAGNVQSQTGSGNSLTIQGLQANAVGTFKKGDVIYIQGVNSVNQGAHQDAGIPAQFVLTADAPQANSSGVVTISVAIAGQSIISDPTNPYQNVTIPIPASAPVFLAQTHTPNIMMHRDALVVAMPPLAELDPASVDCKVVTDPESNISLRYARGSVITSDLNIQRFDCLLGVAFFPEYSVRICG